jgi:membrane-bound serine protease (ClpP class)
MITMAADVAAMAPGTNIGAAHPVAAGGQEINETMSDKIINDLVAFTKGVAARTTAMRNGPKRRCARASR